MSCPTVGQILRYLTCGLRCMTNSHGRTKPQLSIAALYHGTSVPRFWSMFWDTLPSTFLPIHEVPPAARQSKDTRWPLIGGGLNYGLGRVSLQVEGRQVLGRWGLCELGGGDKLRNACECAVRVVRIFVVSTFWGFFFIHVRSILSSPCTNM